MDNYSAPHHGGDSPNPNPNPNKHKHSPKSSTELLSSAKLVAEAAKSSFGGGGGKSKQEVDKAKAAEAAADLICAASHYGKLEEKGIGKYVDQAEDYLHKYHASHGSGPAATAASASLDHDAPAAHKPTTHAAGDGGSEGGSGYADYFKMAQGLLKK